VLAQMHALTVLASPTARRQRTIVDSARQIRPTTAQPTAWESGAVTPFLMVAACVTAISPAAPIARVSPTARQQRTTVEHATRTPRTTAQPTVPVYGVAKPSLMNVVCVAAMGQHVWWRSTRAPPMCA